MIEINLLSAGEKRRPGRRPAGGAGRPALKLPAFSGDPYMAGVGALALLVLLGLGFAYWRVDGRLAEVRAGLETAARDSVTFAGTIDLMTELQERQDTIEQKISVIREVDERRYVWPHLMDEISRAVPPYTWLSKLSAAEEEAAAPAQPKPAGADTAKADSAKAAGTQVPVGPGFTVEGNAGSTQALTLFMKNLEESPFIRDVTLVTSEQATANGRSFQKFTLEARYELPDSSFVETVPIIPVQ